MSRHFRGDGHDHSLAGAVGLIGCAIVGVWLVIVVVAVWAVLNLVPAIVEALTR